MKKLTAIALAAGMVSSFSFAECGDMSKIDTDFDSLDNNDDMYISQEEADDNNVWSVFKEIDKNGDMRLSQSEFVAYTTQHPCQVEEGEEIPDTK